MSLERLRDELLSKKPVIHTRFADQFINEAQDVESIYNQHYHTHVPLGDTRDYAERLIKQVQAGRTVRGAVVAPWGYGKTSTLIYTWRACEEAGVIAVPPFVCSSLLDILKATYGWVAFRLGRPWQDELRSVYQRYGQSAFDERVKSYAAETGVTETDARVILQRALDDRSFTPELTPINLMTFLEYVTDMVKRAGFQGLVVLPDELQQYYGNSANVEGTTQKLREVVLWLAAHGRLSLGLILCMPDTTEGMIQQVGQDVLDRLKEQRFYISLRNIYSPDFPIQLWDRYVTLYEVGSEAECLLDRNVLRATGQIATREDLGRGPRTVIDVFQCALRHYDKLRERYTPVTLIDDFLTNQISFDMQGNPIRFAVEDALAALKSQITSEAHRTAVKLWAAFPEHGCSDDVLEAYGVKQAADELSDMHGVHGPLLTYQSVGYTLRKLATFTPGGTAVERIARDFWLAYKEQDPRWAEAAQAAFITHVLPRIFEKRRQAWGNWDLTLTTARGYAGRLTGSFSDQYPDRVLDLQIATDPTRIEPRGTNAQSDFQFDFVLWRGRSPDDDHAAGRIEYVAGNTRWVRFTLNLGSRALAGANLPLDLRNLKSNIHPNFLTPLLMLAFVDYAQRWEGLKPDNRILENERGPVNAIIESMLNYALRVLFNDELKTSFGQRLTLSGLQVVREVFLATCQTLWPPETYHPLLPLMRGRALDDYLNALNKLSVREKRGDVPLGERHKGKLASLFGIDSHKTFENRAKTDYTRLMQYKDLGGDQAQVQLCLHPLEQQIMQEMVHSDQVYRDGEHDHPAMKAARLLSVGDALGYRPAEEQAILKLLVTRELVRIDDRSKVIYRVPSGPSHQEVEQRLTVLRRHTHALPTALVTDRDKGTLTRDLEALWQRFAPDLDEEGLEEVALRVSRLEGDLAALINRKRQSLLDEAIQQAQQLQTRAAALQRASELDEDVPNGLDFRRHLMDLQDDLRKERRAIQTELTSVQARLKDVQDKLGGPITPDVLPIMYEQYTRSMEGLKTLIARIDRLDHQRKGLVEWFKLLRESDALYKSLSTLPELRRRLTDEVVREIMRTFTQKRAAALVEDSEHFRGRFDEIIRERDAEFASGHEKFGAVKERYRNWLKAMGVERTDFAARYSPVEHEQSYQDIYDQVRSLAIAHVETLTSRISDLDLGLRRARRIRYQKLDPTERQALAELEQRRTDLQAEVRAVHKWLEMADLTQANDLDDQALKIAAIGQTVSKVDRAITQIILPPVAPQTSEEQSVLALLGGRREVDLTELVLNAGDGLDLGRIMDGLKGLYEANQITIKVSKRG